MIINEGGCKKYNILNRFVLLICIFAAAMMWTGCQRKTGVKPGGKLKTNTSKCKCKKKNGGIYSEVYIQKPASYYFNQLSGIEVKG